MVKKLSGAEFPLKKVFSTDFEYSIPSYQRPYAWTVDETSALVNDLYDFFMQNKGKEDESYFLGSIVLIKEENKPKADVVDGQQRLTTLTILLAVIAYKFLKGGEVKFSDHIKNYILEPGNPLERVEPKPRLSLRERDRKFFEYYIQNLEFEKLVSLDLKNPELDNDSKKNIRLNSILLMEKIENMFNNDYEKLVAFGTFLVTDCFLVAVSTPNQQSAFRVFSVLNDRGLNLLPTDIIKADIIGTVEKNSQNDYTEAWENIEDQIGREEFHELFAYIRMIFAKKKAQQTLLEEFRKFVKTDGPEELFDEVINPFAQSFKMLNSCNIHSVNDAEKVNELLRCLKRIKHSDWLPPAILFLSRHINFIEDSYKFFKKLERLAAYLYVCGKGVNYRIERYAEVIKLLENPNVLIQDLDSLDLYDYEISEMKEILDGPIYENLAAHRRNYIILRLDAFLSDGGAKYDPTVLTIEHVLPQNVPQESEWAKWWPDSETRDYWVHRIANLVPLSRQRNSRAQNFDFEEKKNAYFLGRKEVSSYILTSQVLGKDTWTPTDVEERQNELLTVLFENWNL